MNDGGGGGENFPSFPAKILQNKRANLQ